MRAVLKIGGSLLYDDKGALLEDRVRDYASVIQNLIREEHVFIIIVGGGKPARDFITAARNLGASETQCDWLGIKLARHNATLLCAALGELAYPVIVESLDELEVAFRLGKVVLMGGLTPGQSTNAVAALAAEVIRADRLMNATNVEGVYDRDPKKPGAKFLQEVSIRELEEILSHGGMRAGEYKLFDPVAIRVIARSKIPTIIFNGTQPNNLQKIINNEKLGTIITYEEEGET